MQVDDLARKRVEEPRLEHPHETGEHHEVRLAGGDGRDVTGLTLALQFGLERRRVEKCGRYAKPWAKRQDAGIGHIGKDLHDPGPAQPTFRLGAQKGLGIRSAPGAQDDNTHGRQHSPAARILAMRFVVLNPGRNGMKWICAPTASSAARSWGFSFSSV